MQYLDLDALNKELDALLPATEAAAEAAESGGGLAAAVNGHSSGGYAAGNGMAQKRGGSVHAEFVPGPDDDFIPVDKSPGLKLNIQAGVQTIDNGRMNDRDFAFKCAQAYISKSPGAYPGMPPSGAHNHTFALACTLVNGFGLDHGQVKQLMNGWNATCDPPWTEPEINHKIDDAFNKTYDKPNGHKIPERGKPAGVLMRQKPAMPPPAKQAEQIAPAPSPLGDLPPQPPQDQPDDRPIISNYDSFIEWGDNGKPKEIKEARSITDVDASRIHVVGNWPRRIENDLFIPGEDGYARFFRDESSLFGWMNQHAWIRWVAGKDYILKREYFKYLEETVPRYESLELHPHWPPRPNTYYMHDPVVGPGGKISEFLDFFSYADPLDRQLLHSFMMTLFWGGEPGARPVFVITAADDDAEQGRGVGKTMLISIISELVGGFLDIMPTESLDTVKTRLLSEDGRTKRLVRLDNLKSLRFSHADIEGLVTSPTISGRKLYRGEGKRPNLITLAITANGASFSKDMAQRVITIKLDRPRYRPGWEIEVKRFVRIFRMAILADLRDALISNPAIVFDEDSWLRWGPWQEAILSKQADPMGCLELIRARQAEVDADEESKADLHEFIVSQIQHDLPCPDANTVVCRISTQTMAKWVSDAKGEKMVADRASILVKNLGFAELSRGRSNKHRYWLWRGLGSNPNSNPDLEGQLL